jgi:DNA repair exonuclease SbcCD ATPase subunit
VNRLHQEHTKLQTQYDLLQAQQEKLTAANQERHANAKRAADLQAQSNLGQASMQRLEHVLAQLQAKLEQHVVNGDLLTRSQLESPLISLPSLNEYPPLTERIQTATKALNTMVVQAQGLQHALQRAHQQQVSFSSRPSSGSSSALRASLPGAQEVDAYRRQQTQLQEEVRALRKALDEAHQHVLAGQQRSDDLELQLSQQETEQNTLLAQVQAERSELAVDNDRLSLEVEEIREQLYAKMAEVDELTMDKVAAEQSYQLQQQQWQHELQLKHDELAFAKADLTRLQDDARHVPDVFVPSPVAGSFLGDEPGSMADLEDELEVTRASLHALQRQLHDANQLCQHLDGVVSQGQAELSEVQSALATLQVEHEPMAADLHRCQHERDNASVQLQDTNSRLQGAMQGLKEAAEEVSRLEAQLQATNDELEAANVKGQEDAIYIVELEGLVKQINFSNRSHGGSSDHDDAQRMQDHQQLQDQLFQQGLQHEQSLSQARSKHQLAEQARKQLQSQVMVLQKQVATMKQTKAQQVRLDIAYYMSKFGLCFP